MLGSALTKYTRSISMLILLYVIFVILVASIIHMWIDHFKAPRLGAVYTDDRELPLLSVLVPARNEESNIARCIESLIKQDYPNYEIIIIDDNSTDKTFAIAEEYANKLPNIKILKCPEKPPGWLGKSFALHYGVSKAQGKYFAFIDADVTLSTQILSKTMWFIIERKASMISLLPTLVNETFWENTVQPVMGFMIVLTHQHRLVNNPHSSRVVANGQYILFEREGYFKIGG